MTTEETCEACRHNPVEILVDEDDPAQPYRVCTACARRLRQFALRPLEWFNLAAIHGTSKPLLHDFYYESGKAHQSEEEVEEPERYPSPTLEQVSGNLERLLDYATTLDYMDALAVAALGQHDKNMILAALKQRVAAYQNDEIEAFAYNICAEVLGTIAEDWIRERWSTWNLPTFLSLAAATSSCLPFDEGFGRVVQVFEDEASLSLLQQDRPGWTTYAHAFVSFHSRRTLDWMETHPTLVSHQDWGWVASKSHFSWPRAVCWLQQGRPLSHIALYAIQACYLYDNAQSQKYRPVLEDAAPVDEMRMILQSYYEADHVPRVRKLVESIDQRHRREERGH